MSVINISVTADTKSLVRETKLIKAKIAKTTARAINETLSWARSQASKEVATDLRLPQKIIKKRIDMHGKVKGDRATISRAHRNKPLATITVYTRGIPVGQVAGAQTKRGVKAKGGRMYVGAFRAVKKSNGQPLVLKRFPQAENASSKTKTFTPKIGVHNKLRAAFAKRLEDGSATAEYRKRFSRLARANIR